MPGSSLWLVPPPTHPLHATIAELIERTLPSTFPDLTGPAFAPHMTLTSGIDPAVYADAGPQAWLDAVPWPRAADVDVRLERVATQDIFFRRCYLKVAFEKGDTAYTSPWFLSSCYDEVPPGGSNPIDDQKLDEISKAVEEAGVSLSSSSRQQEDDASGQRGGWKGGVVWLVPTDRPINEWKPIATRALD
ncbi:2- 3 cyclic phosphodiesterase [Apiospora rasikravindrae]|uniref:2- 3 cyclic phosphodiesterase n=1 Tax=Apiospora rasikravindrae TaxID=990691 RepID=A0ABR1RPY3_9PEZI